MLWIYVVLVLIGMIMGCAIHALLSASKTQAIGTLNVVHWSDRNDDLLLQLDEDTSELIDGQHIVLNVKCSRR